VLDDLKSDVREKMYEMAKEQKGDPSLIVKSKVKAEELKKMDLFFEKTGIEEMDLEPNIERLGLRTDTDYREILQNSQLKQMRFTQQKSKEEMDKRKNESEEAKARRLKSEGIRRRAAQAAQVKKED